MQGPSAGWVRAGAAAAGGRMFSWMGRQAGGRERAGGADAVQTVTGGLRSLYLRKVLPLEEAYRFHEFHSPALEDADFENKPMILLVGQYSTGKTTFIRYCSSRRPRPPGWGVPLAQRPQTPGPRERGARNPAPPCPGRGRLVRLAVPTWAVLSGWRPRQPSGAPKSPSSPLSSVPTPPSWAPEGGHSSASAEGAVPGAGRSELGALRAGLYWMNE